MKKFILFSLLIFFCHTAGARNLWAFLTYCTFNSPEGPYVETYLTVAGNSVKYMKKENGKFRATVNVLMTFKLNGEIKAFKKYELNSPEVDDTSNVNYEFIDQQRFALENGSYDFILELSDKNKDVKPVPFSQPVVVTFPADKPSFSGIQLLKSYTKTETPKSISKSGYDLVPYVYNFYPGNESSIIFYAELYNMEKIMPAGDKYVLSYFIESFETHMKYFEFARIKKNVVHPIDVLLTEFNITNLATGNYNVVVEARNQQNEIIASQKVFFQRSNPNAKLNFESLTSENTTNSFVEKITNPDTLKEFISCTFPISGGIERAYIKDIMKSKKSVTDLQQYFYGFWLRRDAVNPEQAWLAYKEQVKIAQYNFHTPVKKGYQTDRGRVFLEYGAPNVRSERPNEPTSYPYEIWQYYTLNNNQRNKKFVFYSPDMVTNDYFLLHSDATGEIYNPRWSVDLQIRTYSPLDLGDTQTISSWGEMSKDYWELPN
jgi:GWxTD domain-containing protein